MSLTERKLDVKDSPVADPRAAVVGAGKLSGTDLEQFLSNLDSRLAGIQSGLDRCEIVIRAFAHP